MVKNIFKSPAFKREAISGASFDKENIKILRGGKEVNLYEMIQLSREDTEIYPTLEKYGSIKPMELDIDVVHGDFSDIQNLRDLKEQEKAAIRLWESLPLSTRQEFNNDRYNFVENADKWLKNKIALRQAELEKAKQMNTTEETKEN